MSVSLKERVTPPSTTPLKIPRMPGGMHMPKGNRMPTHPWMPRDPLMPQDPWIPRYPLMSRDPRMLRDPWCHATSGCRETYGCRGDQRCRNSSPPSPTPILDGDAPDDDDGPDLNRDPDLDTDPNLNPDDDDVFNSINCKNANEYCGNEFCDNLNYGIVEASDHEDLKDAPSFFNKLLTRHENPKPHDILCKM